MSRALTDHEREIAQQRAAQLDELKARSVSMLSELVERVGSPVPSAIDACLKSDRERLVQDPMARVWWLTRLGVWVAMELQRRFDGKWELDRDPSSRTFLRPVVGQYAGVAELRHDPMQISSALVDAQEPLEGLLDAIGEEIGKAR